MAYGQLGRVTGNRRMKPDQVAMMNARRQMLPQMMAQKERGAEISRQNKRFNKEMGFRKDQMSAQKDAARAAMGVKAAGLGTTLAMSDTAGRTLGQVPGLKSIFPSGNTFGDLRTGDLVGSALTGYGASKLVNKKKKGLGLLAGVGGGAATSLVSGGNPFVGAATGGLGSLIGRLF